MKTKQKI